MIGDRPSTHDIGDDTRENYVSTPTTRIERRHPRWAYCLTRVRKNRFVEPVTRAFVASNTRQRESREQIARMSAEAWRGGPDFLQCRWRDFFCILIWQTQVKWLHED